VITNTLKNPPKKEKLQSIIKAATALGYHHLSTDEAKKLSAMLSKENLLANVEAISTIQPMLELIELEVSKFKFEIKRKVNSTELERIMIMMPYSPQLTTSEYNCKLYGVDTCHVRDTEMKDRTNNNQKDTYVFESLKVVALSTRTPFNNILVLGIAIVYSESSEDVEALLKFLMDNGVLIDDITITILSDRSKAIASAIKKKTPNAYHALCPLHLKRNIISNGWGNYMDYFQKARIAVTEGEYNYRMEKLKEVCPQMHDYLTESVVEGKWACYELYER
jgi:hypothetical protein